MELTDLLPFIERTGAAGAVLLGIWLWFTRQDLKETRAELRELRDKFDDVRVKQIADGQSAYSVIENNTRETKTLIELVKLLPSMLNRRRRIG